MFTVFMHGHPHALYLSLSFSFYIIYPSILSIYSLPLSLCSSEVHSQSAAMPAPTLEFAAICLSNAKFLLPATPPVVSDDPPNSTPAVPAPPGPPIQGHSISSLRSAGSLSQTIFTIKYTHIYNICTYLLSLCRCYVLACQAYVSLGLGDPVTSLASSRELLATPLLSGGLRFLGQV